MATLQALAISGIRGYNPEGLQRIDFTHPLTLINGKNGSGKTTIIQCLKYITTGVLPPSTNKQKSFIMDPSIAGTAEVKGDIRLRFRTSKSRVVIAKKVMMVSKTTKGLSFRAVQQSLKTKDQDGKQIQVSQRCADIQKQIPEMLGISKPILDNIVFCHQDQSLWPFSDNNTLKGIFDQLFDTKRFTKTLQNLKQALKDYEKQRTQLKGQIDYLKAAYNKFLQSRTESLNSLVQVVQASQQVCQIRKKLQPLKQTLTQISNKQIQKNELISLKGVLQYKIAQKRQRMNKVQEDYLQLEKQRVQQVNVNECEIEIQKLQFQIKDQQKQLRLMQKVLQQIRQKQISNRRKSEFNMEVNRVKEFLIEDLNNNENFMDDNSHQNDYMPSKQGQRILKFLNRKITQLRIKQNKIKQLKIQQNQIIIPFIYKQVAQTPAQSKSKNQINKQKQQLLVLQKKQQKKKQDLQMQQKRIRNLYQILYNPNIQQNSVTISGQHRKASERLSKIQAQIQLKKQQLRKYQQMKPRAKSFEQELYQVKYTGIQLQIEMLQFARKKRQCGLCMRKLNDQDIQDLKSKISKTMKKTQARIQQMKKSYNPSTDIDPVPIVKQIQNFIDTNTKFMNELIEQKQKYDKYTACKHQIQLNNELNRLMQSLGFKSMMIVGSKEKGSVKREDYSIQNFKELVNQYRVLVSQYKNISLQYTRAKQASQRNQRMKKQFQVQIEKKQRIEKQCQILQSQVKNLAMLQNISKKCTQLSALIKRQEQKGQNFQQNSQQLINQINKIESNIKNKLKQKRYLQLCIQYTNFVKELQQHERNLRGTMIKINDITSIKNENSDLYNEKNKLQVQQATILTKIDMKKSLFSNLMQKQQSQYLNKLLRYNALSSIISDIQVTMKAMERATNRLHNQKMDQINKILFDIWQQVYNAKDIEYIRINSIAEKKNPINGYGYSIMMQKNNQLIQMKGRCSMGQKVLASLIIRMALAQAFSASTHILALDEPTTNLDRAHIQNLAESISSIIQLEQNSRLQLIIISHDLEFIGLLRKHTSYYYEISRNQRNFSTIKRREIGELGIEGKVQGMEAIHY